MLIPKKFATVNGLEMAYVEVGEGDPIVFLHGNPTSSFLWRFIWPQVVEQGRVIVPDLIGMGDSDPLLESGPGSYRYVEHREYLFALLDQLGVTENVTLVVHDWGSALGFDWAYQHPEAVKGIMYMEAIVQPVASWDDWGPSRAFKTLRSEAGEQKVLEENYFVERILPASVIRDLSEDEMAEYRRPFLEAGERRRPTLTWPREIPIEGEPADVHEIVDTYSAWMAENEIPKFFVNAEPGAILIGDAREFCRTWKNQREISVPGSHFVQEDSGAMIGVALSTWLEAL